jgi:hypothetical protein
MSQVTDYNIANASGASVRSDLNAVFDAIKTLNSGGSDPSNTEAFMPFVDTGDGNKLKIRNSSNNDFTTIGPVDTPNLGLLATTGGTMTGVLQLPVGSATAPSINFGQTNTGIFKGSSHRVSFTSDGTQVFYADGTGININSSKELRWKDANNSNYLGFKAANNITSNLTLTLPTADGSSGQALLTNGSGTLSFGAPTVGAANLTGNTLASGVTASSLTSFTGTDFGFNTTPGGTPATKAVFLAIGDSDTGIAQDGDGQLEIWSNNVEIANFNASAGVTVGGNILPSGTRDLGSSSARWENLYVNDMHFSNEGKNNDVDGSWGDWTLQEGKNNIFMINNRSGKKFKIALIPV